jgi:hypothetical protein
MAEQVIAEIHSGLKKLKAELDDNETLKYQVDSLIMRCMFYYDNIGLNSEQIEIFVSIYNRIIRYIKII